MYYSIYHSPNRMMVPCHPWAWVIYPHFELKKVSNCVSICMSQTAQGPDRQFGPFWRFSCHWGEVDHDHDHHHDHGHHHHRHRHRHHHHDYIYSYRIKMSIMIMIMMNAPSPCSLGLMFHGSKGRWQHLNVLGLATRIDQACLWWKLRLLHLGVHLI